MCGMNILVDLMYWIMYEVIIFLSDPIDSLNVVIHLSIYCDNHNTHWIQSFLHLQTWPVLQQKIHCCFHTPHLKQASNKFSNVSCGFSSCLMTHFTIFPWLNQKHCHGCHGLWRLVDVLPSFCFQAAVESVGTAHYNNAFWSFLLLVVDLKIPTCTSLPHWCKYHIFVNPLVNSQVSFLEQTLSIDTSERNFPCYKGALQY